MDHTGRPILMHSRLADRTAARLASSPVRDATVVVLRTVIPLAPWFAPATSLAHHLGGHLAPELQVARLCIGGRLVIDPREWSHRHMLFHGVYESATTQFMKRLARPRWTVVDVGANVGYYTILARDLGGAGSRVLALEPNPKLASMLRISVALNRAVHDVALLDAAAGRQHGATAPLRLSTDPANSGLSTMVPPGTRADANATVPVPLVTLDAECESRRLQPDLIKIDVEGFEDEVLAGMQELLSTRIPRAVVCELAPGHRRPEPAEIVAYMAGFGYRAGHILRNGRLSAWRGHITEMENVAFTRSVVV